MVFTQDGSRVYVTLEKSGIVAVIDPLLLRVVDTNSATPEIDSINLPIGASPGAIVVDSFDQYAYIADSQVGLIYVLDINPFSSSYQQVVANIAVTDAPNGLRQLTVSNDNHRLWVTAPDKISHIIVINIDPNDRPSNPLVNDKKWRQKISSIVVDAGLSGISTTPDKSKLLFTERGNEALGYGVVDVSNVDERSEASRRDDPLSFVGNVSYFNLSLGDLSDYFDVNEGTSITISDDGKYGFIAGRNGTNFGSGIESVDGVQAGSNIGIIVDPLGTNPHLVAATRPIPVGLINDLVLSNDGRYLSASSIGRNSVFVFDVQEIIKTIESPENYVIDILGRSDLGYPAYFVDERSETSRRDVSTSHLASSEALTYFPIDDLNPDISVAADYKIIEGDWISNQFTYGVPDGVKDAPVATGGGPLGLAASPSRFVHLLGPGANSNLQPSFTWNFDIPSNDVEQVNLFVSSLPEGEGLLPSDRVINLQDASFLPGLSEQQKLNLLTRRTQGYDDFNPNRIITATWTKETNSWLLPDGTTFTGTANSLTQLVLSNNHRLTAGQTYYIGVQAVDVRGHSNLDLGEFRTTSQPSNNPFSSVTVLTHGFTLNEPPAGIDKGYYDIADKITSVNRDLPSQKGLILRYDKPTGLWIPVDNHGGILETLTGNKMPGDVGYLSTLASHIESDYVNHNVPLVLIPEWNTNGESIVPDSGFSEGAADAIFASMVQLDQALGGDVGEYNNGQLTQLYDTRGNLIRTQGPLFNSPLHFIGFSRGAVVNSEIIQRLGTFYPNAGGKVVNGNLVRDLQMTTIDPHDFNQPGLNVFTDNFGDFHEPKVQVWSNVTFADNYYQTVPNLFRGTVTPAGRDIPNFPNTPSNIQVQLPREGFRSANPDPNGQLLGQPDLSVFLGTNSDNLVSYPNSRAGFTRETDPGISIGGKGAVHQRTLGWYAGTANLSETSFPTENLIANDANVIYRRRGDGYYQPLFHYNFSFPTPPNPPLVSPWYTPDLKRMGGGFTHGNESAPWEGIGTGWFYSVLGGGASLRPYTTIQRVPLDYDNTLEARMRGDFAVPTLFNGNFDAVFNPQGLNRISWSSAIPGWSFHNGVVDGQNIPSSRLVDWRNINTLREAPGFVGSNSNFTPIYETQSYLNKLGIDSNSPTNYALRLENGDSITHNRFLVPEWGTLRFNLHVPREQLGVGRTVTVYIQGDAPNYTTYQPIGTIDLIAADGRLTSGATPELPYHTGYQDADTYRIGFGTQGFETFHVNIPPELRGKIATLNFQVTGATVFLDDVFFKSEVLKFGNPQPVGIESANNYLVEKPQYTLSYNDQLKGPNWVSWKLNSSWVGEVDRPDLSTATLVGYPRQELSIGNYPFENSDYPWLPDSSLPNTFTTTIASDYVKNNLGLQRGHRAPSQDRSRTTKDIYATFLTSNLLPQAGELNRTVWSVVENRSRRYVRQSHNDLYIIAGGAGYESRLEPGYPPLLLSNIIYKRVNGTFRYGEIDGPVIDDIKLQQVDFENGGVLQSAAFNRVIYKNNDGTFRDETPNGAIIPDTELTVLRTIKAIDIFEVGDPIVFGNPIRIQNSKGIYVPQFFWKILIPLQTGQGLNDITADTQVIAVIMPNREALSTNNGRTPIIALPNGVDPLIITNWSEWTQWRVSVQDLERITGYNFFSNLPTEIQNQLEMRRGDSFIDNTVSLLADSTSISSEVSLIEPGNSINLSAWQSDSNASLMPEMRNMKLGSSEVSINKSILSNNNFTQIGSSKGSFSENGICQIRPSEGGIIQVTPAEVSSNQNTVVEVTEAQVSVWESSPVQVSTLETGSFQVGIVEKNVHQFTSGKISPYQNNSSQVQTVQIGTTTTPVNPREVANPTFKPSTQLFSIHNPTPLSITQLILSAQTIWNNLLPTVTPIDITIKVTDLPTGQLASALITKFVDERSETSRRVDQGNPIEGTIEIDADGNGLGWYIDPTPVQEEEFQQPLTESTAFKATPDSPAYGKYDLLSTLLHETAHIAGFIQGNQGFDSHIQTTNGLSFFTGNNLTKPTKLIKSQCS